MIKIKFRSNCTINLIREKQDGGIPANALGETQYDDTYPYANQSPIPVRFVFKKAMVNFDEAGNRQTFDEFMMVDVEYDIEDSDIIVPSIDSIPRRIVGKRPCTNLRGQINHFEYYLETQP